MKALGPQHCPLMPATAAPDQKTCQSHPREHIAQTGLDVRDKDKMVIPGCHNNVILSQKGLLNPSLFYSCENHWCRRKELLPMSLNSA